MRGVHQDPFPYIPEKVRQEGASTRPVQMLKCSAPRCQTKMEVTIKGTRKPPDVIAKMARNKGWLPDMKKGEHLCPDHVNPEKPVTTATDIPAISPEIRRNIFRAIDEAYDEKAKRYVDGFDDKMIAAQVGTTWGWVARVREESFGPPGPDPEIVKLTETIAKLERTAKTVEEMGMRAAEQAEKLATEIENPKARVGCLK